MAFITVIWKYWKIQRSMRKLALAKKNYRRKNQKWKPTKTWYQQMFKYFNKLLTLFASRIRKVSDEGDDGGKNNNEPLGDVLKSAIHFINGLLLVVIIYFFIIYHLYVNETTAVYICIPLSFFLSFGMAFSEKCRCILFLALPQICTGT